MENDIAVDKNVDRTLADQAKAGMTKTGEVITDVWITSKVKWFFVGEDLLKGADINVHTTDHVVTLKGTVTVDCRPQSGRGPRHADRRRPSRRESVDHRELAAWRTRVAGADTPATPSGGARTQPEQKERHPMIPIGDDDTSRRTAPIVTYALIALNVLFFFVELSGGDAFVGSGPWFRAASWPILSAVPLTLVTSMFMHAGWVHLGGNMLYLWIFGDNVEDRFGHVTFTVFYLLCGLAATFAQLAFSAGSNVPNLGASGAIAGVLGAYILLFPQGKVRVLQGQQVIQCPR